jgi:2-dehydro-3-deoxy-D-arabinonate dehydratase
MLVRFYHPRDGARVGLVQDDRVYDVTALAPSVAAWLQSSVRNVPAAIDALTTGASRSSQAYDMATFDPPSPDQPHWLAPVDTQDIWAAGVTYQRSREARQEEALDGGDIYARVYSAERPELFFKAHGSQVVGPGQEVGIRADAAWSVPEPELALVMNPAMEVVGITIGNDMSSRDIEGENPLYLPQAKIYTASCALGPGIVLNPLNDWPVTTISLTIERHGEVVFAGLVHTSQIRRRMADLVDYLARGNAYRDGVVLLTGTGIVPPADFTLARGDRVRIAIDGIGELINTVKVV